MNTPLNLLTALLMAFSALLKRGASKQLLSAWLAAAHNIPALALAFTITAQGAAHAGSAAAVGEPNFQVPFSIELIGDPHGERGVMLKSLNPGPAGYSAREEGILRRGEPGPPPIWRLMQAYSKQHIAAVEPVTLAAGQKRWTNACKEFILGHGTPDADFVLAVNSIEEYGKDYVWFGVPFYDDRHPVISPSYMRDGTGKEDESKGEKLGTGRFINSVGTKPFAEHGLIPGEWLNIRVDVLPLMVEALERAWSRGFCNSSTNLADYKIGSMNIGWEVPGLSAVSAQIKDLSLLATGPKAEK